MTANIFDILDSSDPLIAVVGATDDAKKFGSIIYRDLKRKGFRVIPVNPRRTRVDGDPCAAGVGALPTNVDLLCLVVPPDQGLVVLTECLEHGFRDVWLQPGAEDARVIQFLQANQFNFLAQTCIMLKTRPKR